MGQRRRTSARHHRLEHPLQLPLTPHCCREQAASLTTQDRRHQRPGIQQPGRDGSSATALGSGLLRAMSHLIAVPLVRGQGETHGLCHPSHSPTRSSPSSTPRTDGQTQSDSKSREAGTTGTQSRRQCQVFDGTVVGDDPQVRVEQWGEGGPSRKLPGQASHCRGRTAMPEGHCCPPLRRSDLHSRSRSGAGSTSPSRPEVRSRPL